MSDSDRGVDSKLRVFGPDSSEGEVARQTRKFRVALSFPGEKRPFIERVAQELANTVGREKVLYDKFFEAEFARPNLDVLLPELYAREADLVAVFFCEEYARKPWCGLEWRQIRTLIMDDRADAVMPFRFDQTPIAGLSKGDGYIDVGARDPAAIAGLILRRLETESEDARGLVRGMGETSPVKQFDPSGQRRHPNEFDQLFGVVRAALGQHDPAKVQTFDEAVARAGYARTRAQLADQVAAYARRVVHELPWKGTATRKYKAAAGGKPHGRVGMVRFNSGDEYSGQMLRDTEDGLGVSKVYTVSKLSTPNGVSLYMGDNELANFGPSGVYRFVSGSMFAGDWLDGRPAFGHLLISSNAPYDHFLGQMGEKQSESGPPSWKPNGNGVAIYVKERRLEVGWFTLGAVERQLSTSGYAF